MIFPLGDQGASKVRHVVVAHQDLMQSFQQADNELSALKQKLEGGEVCIVYIFLSYLYFFIIVSRPT